MQEQQKKKSTLFSSGTREGRVERIDFTGGQRVNALIVRSFQNKRTDRKLGQASFSSVLICFSFFGVVCYRATHEVSEEAVRWIDADSEARIDIWFEET